MAVLRLFGHPVLERDDRRGVLRIPPKAVALVAMAAANAVRPLSRDWLADVLWPDADPPEARANLRRHLHLVAKVLGGDAFTVTRQTVQWNHGASLEVDVAQFDVLVKSEPSLAADYYAGELCAGIEEPALDDLRLRYRSEYQRLLHRLIAQSKESGNRNALRSWLQRLIGFDPFDEQAVGDLMRLQKESGDRAGAIREYNALSQRLRAELGMDPQPETVALFAQVVREDCTPATPHNVVSATTTFVGRERELATIANGLRESRVAVLIGPGGVGKSRLATRSCFELLASYPSGVWFVNLEHAGGEADIWQGIADAACISGSENRETAVLQHFSRANALIVLDTCEHVYEPARAVIDRIAAGTAVRVLATSRRRLGLSGACEIEIGALDVPPATPVDGVSPLRYSAYQLFLERAVQAYPAFRVEERNVAALTGLLRSIDGLPLAIELLASRANVLSISGMRKRLREALRAARGREDRNRTIDAALAWSWGLLTDEQRELFAALAVFRGAFTVDDVDAVCTQFAHTVPCLFELLDASLVSALPGAEGMRYRLLETTRGYALEKLAAAFPYIAKSHAEYFARKADALATITDKAVSGLLEQTLQSMPDFLAALDYSVECGAAELGLRFLEGLHKFGIRNHFNREIAQRALALLKCSESAGATHARIARIAGMLAESGGRYQEALGLFASAVSYYREAGDELLLCDALTGIAVVDYHLGRYEDCERRFIEIRDNAERLGDAMLLLKTLGRLGALYLSQAQFDKSLPLLERAATGLRELGELRQSGTALKNLATAAYYAGLHKEAVEWVNQALEDVAATSEVPMLAMALCMRGCAHRELGEMEAALNSLIAGSQFFPALSTVSSDLAECLEDVASTVGACGEEEAAARIVGYCDALRRSIESPLNPGLRAYYDRTSTALASKLGAAFEPYRALGAEETPESAVALAVQTLKRVQARFRNGAAR